MFKLLMCAAIVAAGFTACSEEVTPIDPEQPGGTNSPAGPVGELTNATFNFKLTDGAMTKVVYPDADDPTTVTEFRVLIFKASDSKLEIDTVVNFAANPTLTISLLSGTKRIFVYANGGITVGTPPAPTVAPAYIGTPATGGTFAIGTGTLDDINGEYSLVTTTLTPPAFYTDVPNLHALYPNTGTPAVTKFYFSNVIAKSTIGLDPGISAVDSQDPANNNFKAIELERPVAKVSITKTGDVGPTSNPLPGKIITKDSAGIITDVKYKFWTVNVSMFPFQNSVGSQIKTPEYIPLNDADSANLKNQYARELGLTAANNYIDIPTRGASAPAPGTGLYYYIPENNPSVKMKGNTTIASVQATFSPTKNHYVVFNAAQIGSGVNYNETGSGAFTVYPASADLPATPVADMYLFTEPGVTGLLENTLFAGADALKLVKKVVYHRLNPTVPPKSSIDDPVYSGISATQIATYFITYYGGKAYYRLNLGEQQSAAQNDYTVRRNYYYDANITGFTKLGENTPNKLIDPITEILEGPTNLTVQITLRNWVGKQISGEV